MTTEIDPGCGMELLANVRCSFLPLVHALCTNAAR